ncbi:pre-mRNA-splicing factor SYF1, partial [Tanacetum coccineum]
HQFVAGKYRLSEACYFLKTIKCIYSIGKSLCALGGINIHTTLDMAWDTGSLSHALCASPVNPLFMKTLLEHNIKSDGVQFWTDNRIRESQKVRFKLCLSVCPTISLVNSHSDAHAIKAQKTIDVIKSDASMQGHKKLLMDACMHAAQNERLRLRVFVQVLFSDHVKISKAIASNTVKETGESHDKATKAVPASKQLSMHEIYIARAAKIYGLPETLEIYEHAISSEGLLEKDAIKICIKYAEFGKSHGETNHMLYEFNIMSTSLPDINHPNLAPEYQSQSTLLSFDVPACPRSSRLKGLTVTFRYTISDDDWDALGEHHLTLEQEIVAFVLQAFFSRPKVDSKGSWSHGFPSLHNVPSGSSMLLPPLQKDKRTFRNVLTAASKLKKSLNLLNTARVVVTPSGDCIPTTTLVDCFASFGCCYCCVVVGYREMDKGFLNRKTTSKKVVDNDLVVTGSVLGDLAEKVKNIDGKILGKDGKPMMARRYVHNPDVMKESVGGDVRLADDVVEQAPHTGERSILADQQVCIDREAVNRPDLGPRNIMESDTSCCTNVAPIELNKSSTMTLPKAALDEVNARFVNTLYGFPVGKKLAFHMVENYTKIVVLKRCTESMIVNGLGMGLAMLCGLVILTAVSPKQYQSMPTTKVVYSDSKCLTS